jgi:gluconokinase
MRDGLEIFGGLDIGTTGCRVSFFRADGTPLASAHAEYPLDVPRVGWAEQDPELIFTTLRRVFAEALAALPAPATAVRALTFSSVLHSIFPVNERGEPLHPMLTFADTRAQGVLGALAEAVDTDALYRRTGCPLHPMYPLAKILWFRHERPELFRAAAKFVSIKEYVLHRLTGEWLVDASLASGSGLFDNRRLDWDSEALAAVGITPDRLSAIRPTTHVVTRWASDAFGMPPEVPLVLGAGDGMLSTLGAGAVGKGQYTAMIGTSGAVRLCVDAPLTDPKSRNWCYNLCDDLWIVGGAINNGGLAFRWARDKFAANEQHVAEKLNLDTYEVLSRYAEQKPAGSDGLVFLPFLTGERSPHWNANARGVLFGLNLNHGKRHLMRATLEGILYSMYSVFRSLRDLAGDDAAVEIRSSGSFSRSNVWVQMMADVFGHPIVLPGPPEGSAFGAAALGMIATGRLGRPDDVRKIVGAPKAIARPNATHHERYQKLYGIYERVYRNLLDEFDEIARLQRELAEQREAEKP